MEVVIHLKHFVFEKFGSLQIKEINDYSWIKMLTFISLLKEAAYDVHWTYHAGRASSREWRQKLGLGIFLHSYLLF